MSTPDVEPDAAASAPTSAPTSPPPTAPPSSEAEAPDASSADPTGDTFDPDLPQSSLRPGYYTNDGVPTFDAVAERIQERIATADGNEVLDELSQGRDSDDEMEQLKQAGKDRLAQLRKSMGL